MILKITKKEHPLFFTKSILEFEIDQSHKEHRRGSNFFTQSVLLFKPTDSEYFPGVENFDDYVGTWETNVYISDSEYGNNWDEVNELTRVTQKEKVTVEKYWEAIKL